MVTIDNIQNTTYNLKMLNSSIPRNLLSCLLNITILWSLPCYVQGIPAYECTKNGKTIYQPFPCADTPKLSPEIQKSTKEQDLIVFSKQGNEALVYKLLTQGVSPNATDQNNNSALFYALEQQHYNIARLLMASNANVNHILASGVNLLIFFSQKGDLQALQLLLTNKVNIDYQTIPEGDTALLLATEAKQIDAVALLLRSGADPNTANNIGFTPLIAALQNKDFKIIKALLQQKANVNQLSLLPDKKISSTPLIHFATYGNQENILLLLKLGADINLANEQHISPLGAAALVGHLDTVNLLLDAGADPKQLTNETQLWEYVKTRTNKQIAAVIEEKIKNPNFPKNAAGKNQPVVHPVD